VRGEWMIFEKYIPRAALLAKSSKTKNKDKTVKDLIVKTRYDKLCEVTIRYIEFYFRQHRGFEEFST
jgi:hypothetical protein